MKKQNEKLLTIEDVAKFLQVKPSVIKYWINSRDIPFIKLGKYYRFESKEICTWINEHKGNNGNFGMNNSLKSIT